MKWVILNVKSTKDPQIRMTEIIEAAEDLFNAHGYQETQVNDIVKVIGVVQGTFFYYFNYKEEVVEAIMDEKRTEFSLIWRIFPLKKK